MKFIKVYTGLFTAQEIIKKHTQNYIQGVSVGIVNILGGGNMD